MLLAFSPFLIFVLIERLGGGAQAGLTAGAATSGLLILRDLLNHRTSKILDIGTLLLFSGLAAIAWIGGPAWSIIGIRLRVDAGLLVIVLVSLALRQPFTLQYAREQVPPELWTQSDFLHTNFVITSVWAAAFAVMVLADLVLLYLPGVPPWFGIGATIAALYGAIRFTGTYKQAQPSLN